MGKFFERLVRTIEPLIRRLLSWLKPKPDTYTYVVMVRCGPLGATTVDGRPGTIGLSRVVASVGSLLVTSGGLVPPMSGYPQELSTVGVERNIPTGTIGGSETLSVDPTLHWTPTSAAGPSPTSFGMKVAAQTFTYVLDFNIIKKNSVVTVTLDVTFVRDESKPPVQLAGTWATVNPIIRVS